MSVSRCPFDLLTSSFRRPCCILKKKTNLHPASCFLKENIHAKLQKLCDLAFKPPKNLRNHHDYFPEFIQKIAETLFHICMSSISRRTHIKRLWVCGRKGEKRYQPAKEILGEGCHHNHPHPQLVGIVGGFQREMIYRCSGRY